MAQISKDPSPVPNKRSRPGGMPGFTLVWAGQIISVLSSNMSNFALTIWAFQQTGSATTLGIIQACFLLPEVLVSPLAGAMVDRYNRKLMMMVSDLAAVLATAGILVLHANGALQTWHLYITSAIYGLGNCFQWPAYMATITSMIPKEQYGRANGMMMLVDSGPMVFSPLLAGALLPVIGLAGILAIDLATFFLAIGALLVVHVPQPAPSAEGQAAKGSLLQEGLYGFKYLFSHRSLLALQSFVLLINLVGGIGEPLFTPMILLRTGNNSTTLGTVLSVAAAGGVAGGLLVSAWGGFRRRMRGVLFSWGMFGLFGLVLFGLGRSLWVWLPVIFLAYMSFPLSQSAVNAIWQSKVPPDLQGRVFSARRVISWLVDPLMPILAGSLADHVTEPAMTSQTPLAHTFGWLVGSSPGSGMALQFVLAGVLYVVLVAAAFSVPIIRDVEKLMPDHDQPSPI
jgi:MFS transporter, DHA3 family, macrolide efflux protein